MTWIVDPSVAMAWCFEDEATPRTDAFLDRLNSEPMTLPLHWPLEVSNSLRSAIRRSRMNETIALGKLNLLMTLPARYDMLTHQLAFSAIYSLAGQHKLTTYDAAYLELAIRLDAELATNDSQLIVAAQKSGIQLI